MAELYSEILLPGDGDMIGGTEKMREKSQNYVLCMPFDFNGL